MWLGDLPVSTIQNGNTYYIHTDYLGTPRVITDSDNTEVWKWESDPFGIAAANDDPDGDGVHFSYNLRFPGQYHDVETGLSYNYYRTYNPSIGRYIESDLIGLKGGMNTYTYVDNNPLVYFDQNGLLRSGRNARNDSVCHYYLEACSKYGCRYYCNWAPLICATADVNPRFRINPETFQVDPTATTENLMCIRKCLAREDKKAHDKKGCDDGCLTDKEIDDYHHDCFTECGVNPNLYPGVGGFNE